MTGIAFLVAAFVLGACAGYGACLIRRAGWFSPAEVDEAIDAAISEISGGLW